MKKSLFLVFIALITKIGLFAQTSELFPRYTVVDIEPTITGDKSLEQLQNEFQE